eukprot:1075103-Rhodomonas_salina.1
MVKEVRLLFALVIAARGFANFTENLVEVMDVGQRQTQDSDTRGALRSRIFGLRSSLVARSGVLGGGAGSGGERGVSSADARGQSQSESAPR